MNYSRGSGNLPLRTPLESRFEFWLILPLTMKKAFTDKQGQYLAFIYYYSKIHGRPPAEADLQRYFRVSPPSVHQMILTLETHGLIERTPGQARSIHLLISPEELPDLV
jgi:DNA-binding MarR family transcriptional regulator